MYLEASHLIQSTLIFLCVINFIVFFHELGHYTFAKLFGVHVEEFSIGFGPSFASFKDKSGTTWKLCIIPMGGYIKMQQEAIQDEINRLESISQDQSSFVTKPIWQKALIVFAGPLANYILAFFIIAGSLFIYGAYSESLEIGLVEEGGPAHEAGLSKGDVIISIDGVKIKEFASIRNLIQSSPNNEIDVVFLRNKQEFEVSIKPEIKEIFDKTLNQKINYRYIGIAPAHLNHKQYTLLQSCEHATKQIYTISNMIMMAIKNIFTNGATLNELGGPVSIAKYSTKSYDIGGLHGLFIFIAMLSINLGFMNLLPIPLLDGGHLLIYIIEALLGPKAANFVAKHTSAVGFFIIILLTALGIISDIIKLHQGV